MQIAIIAHNIRSIHNVGTLFRTAEGFGVQHLYLSGYTPYPKHAADIRLPHVSAKQTAQIRKVALGAELTVPFSHSDSIVACIRELRRSGWTIAALEQTPGSTKLYDAPPLERVAIIIGEEVNGIADEHLQMADMALEIPMYGQKESFNVTIATAICLYALREHNHYGTIPIY